MTEVDALLTSLAEGLPATARDAGAALAVNVSEVELEIPVESRIDERGLSLTPPRGRLATGFDVPHGRLRVCFVPSSESRSEGGAP